MTKETKLKIDELEKRRNILCDECTDLEYEVRMLEEEIEAIDKQIFQLELLLEEKGEA